MPLWEICIISRNECRGIRCYDSALVYKEDNIGALNNYAYYLSVEREHLDKAEEMSYRTVKLSRQTELISTHMRGYF